MIFDVNAWLGVWPFRSLKDNTPDSLVARLDRSGITHAAVAQIEGIVHRNAQPANEMLARSIEKHRDRLFPVGIINPTYPAWQDDLRECQEQLGMTGIRLFPQYHHYDVAGSEAKAVVEAATERGMHISIPHRVEDTREHHWMDPGVTVDVNKLADLIAAVPEATVIIPNARGIHRTELWKREDLRERNWFVDLSLTEVHYVLHFNPDNSRELAEFIDEGGAAHLVFGSHVPFSYAGAALVKRAVLNVDVDTLAEISYHRAAKLFGIEV
jgi:uncharacterized protein